MVAVKKVICLVLTVLMVFSCVGAATASAADYNHLPQIYVEGYDSKHIYYKDDIEQENALFYPLDGDMLIGNLLNYEKYIKQAVLEKDPNILKNYLLLWMEDCYGMIALKGDGYTMSDEVMVNETELNYKGDGKYVFKYDSRLDPVDIAKELHSYIEWVQQDSGSERIELAGSSFGASVVLAYLYEYPEQRDIIDSVVLCVPSSNGVAFAGELFSGNINLDSDAIQSFVTDNVENEELALLLSVLNKTGTLDYLLEALVEPVLRVALLDAVKQVVYDIFGTFPSMWSFVDDRYFYDAVEYIYGENYDDPNHECAGLISKITYYHDEIMLNNYRIVEEAQADGIKMNIICKYGGTTVPLSQEGDFMGDGFVALDKASFGATSAMSREKLPEDYKQALYPEYSFISPDGCVDASTGLLPFNTWYIRGLSHGSKNDTYYELINTVLYEDLTVFSSERFPQYLIVPEYDDEGLIPTVKEDSFNKEQEKNTPWLYDFLKLISKLIPMLIEKIKAFLSGALQ